MALMLSATSVLGKVHRGEDSSFLNERRADASDIKMRTVA